MVYIDEAHANDIWPLGNHIDLPNHKTISDRTHAASLLKDKFNLQIPVLLDSMTNNFDQEYAVWPERYYFIKNGKLEKIGQPTTEFGYDRKSLEWELRMYVEQQWKE